MKAFTLEKYGDPEEVLKEITIDRPKPQKEEVLVKVMTSSINDFDWSLCSGTPFAYRTFFGLFKPKAKMRFPGMEVAGVVEEIGPKVEKFQVGDRVYGDTSDHAFGSLSEYLAVSEKGLRKFPDEMSFEEAVCFPHASALAMQGLIDLGGIKEGDKVLINGAGGGVGILGVQIAKSYNPSEITGVDSGIKLETMKEFGFDKVIDYQKEDFTQTGEQYDLILDCRTSRFPRAHLRALKPEGRYVSIGGHSGKLIVMVLFSGIIRLFSKKKLKMVAVKPNKDLDRIEKLYAENRLRPLIDGPHSYQDTPKAIKRFGEAKHTGKVVVIVHSSKDS